MELAPLEAPAVRQQDFTVQGHWARPFDGSEAANDLLGNRRIVHRPKQVEIGIWRQVSQTRQLLPEQAAEHPGFNPGPVRQPQHGMHRWPPRGRHLVARAAQGPGRESFAHIIRTNLERQTPPPLPGWQWKSQGDHPRVVFARGAAHDQRPARRDPADHRRDLRHGRSGAQHPRPRRRFDPQEIVPPPELKHRNPRLPARPAGRPRPRGDDLGVPDPFDRAGREHRRGQPAPSPAGRRDRRRPRPPQPPR